jgi:hypothetical protein
LIVECKNSCFCTVTPSTRGTFRVLVRLEVQEDLWVPGASFLLFWKTPSRCIVTSRRIESLLLCRLTDFVDFVSTYLHLQSYSFAVQFQRQVHRYTDTCRDDQNVKRTYGGTIEEQARSTLCIDVRSVKPSDGSARVCVCPIKPHTQAAEVRVDETLYERRSCCSPCSVIEF